MTDELESLKQQLQEALAEIDQLRQENAKLKQSVKASPSPSVIRHNIQIHHPKIASSVINQQSPVSEKISLFRSLF